MAAPLSELPLLNEDPLIGVRFLMTQLESGLLCTQLAFLMREGERAARNTRYARRAYDIVLRFRYRIPMSNHALESFNGQLGRLRTALQELGEDVMVPYQPNGEISFGFLISELENGLRFAQLAYAGEDRHEVIRNVHTAWAAYDTVSVNKNRVRMSERALGQFAAGFAQLTAALTLLGGKR